MSEKGIVVGDILFILQDPHQRKKYDMFPDKSKSKRFS